MRFLSTMEVPLQVSFDVGAVAEVPLHLVNAITSFFMWTAPAASDPQA